MTTFVINKQRVVQSCAHFLDFSQSLDFFWDYTLVFHSKLRISDPTKAPDSASSVQIQRVVPALRNCCDGVRKRFSNTREGLMIPSDSILVQKYCTSFSPANISYWGNVWNFRAANLLGVFYSWLKILQERCVCHPHSSLLI